MNYKENLSEIMSLHSKLRRKHGSATHCESKKCEGKSTIYEWALKKGHEYSDNPKDYKQLCRSCHRRYDLTEEKLNKANKNLWWAQDDNKYPSMIKINQKKADEIRKLFKSGVRVKLLMKKYNMSEPAVYDVINRKSWNN